MARELGIKNIAAVINKVTDTDDLKVIKESPLIAEKSKQSWDRIIRIARKNGQGIRE